MFTIKFQISFSIGKDVDQKSILTRNSWARLRKIVARRDQWTCHYCGQHIKKGQVDHMIPLSKGGTDNLSNLVWACPNCNNKKGDRMIQADFSDLREAEICAEPSEVMTITLITPETDEQEERKEQIVIPLPQYERNGGLPAFCRDLLKGKARLAGDNRGGDGCITEYGYTQSQYRKALKPAMLELGFATSYGNNPCKWTDKGYSWLAQIVAHHYGEKEVPESYHQYLLPFDDDPG